MASSSDPPNAERCSCASAYSFDMASSSGSPDAKHAFQNDYERQWVLKRAAQAAGYLIHNYMDKNDREHVARLAGDVGRKLRDFLINCPYGGLLYKACIHHEYDRVDLATWLAFRSQCAAIGEPNDVIGYFYIVAPEGCPEFDEYLSCRFTLWEDNKDEAIDFREPPAVEHTYWGKDFTETMRRGAEVDDEMLLDYKELDARDFFNTNKPITQDDVRKFMYDCRVHRREHVAKKLQDFAEGRKKFCKEILYTSSGFPIISEPDQIDIVCAFCDDSLPVSSLDQLRSHCRKKGHDFATALSKLGRQGEVLHLRYRDPAATSSPEATGLCTCPGCGQTAETWDAVDWHFSRVHKGKLEDSLHGMHLMQYLAWLGLRTPTARRPSEADRQHKINLEFLSDICSKAARQ